MTPLSSHAADKTPAIIIPYDTVTFPGIEVWPQAKVIVKKFYAIERPVSGERVEFLEGAKYLGLALTGGDGIGVIRYTPHGDGIHKIKIRLLSTSAYEAEEAEMQVGVWDRVRPLLFVHVGALRERPKAVIFPFLGRTKKDGGGRPMDRSVDTLTEISKRFNIVYLYRGELSQVSEIRSWLSENRFPPYPLLIFGDRAGSFKKLISERKTNIRRAIITSDDEADIFRREQVKTLLLVEKKKKTEYKGRPEETVIVTDWEEIRKVVMSDE